MARPRAAELTERELEVMHTFWKSGEQTVASAKDQLADKGRELAYTTVATLVRILTDKGFLEQTNDERPLRFKPIRTFEDVSSNLVTDMVKKVSVPASPRAAGSMTPERMKPRATASSWATVSPASHAPCKSYTSAGALLSRKTETRPLLPVPLNHADKIAPSGDVTDTATPCSGFHPAKARLPVGAPTIETVQL
jgi:predicted transcriptional regulator